MKTCPSCKEEIKDDANVCKHCGQEQDTEEVREMYRQKLREHNIKGFIYFGIPLLILCYFMREDIVNLLLQLFSYLTF